jgi:uncharacterized phiE125 gp8 family phage protein
LIKLLTAATTSILGITATKNYLKVEHSQDDTLITQMIEASILFVENYSGFKTSPETWEQYETGDVAKINLDLAPVDSINSITEYDDFDSTGSLLTASTDFRIAGNDLIHVDGYWPKRREVDGYVINYTVGTWLASDRRIEALKTAALRCVGWLYENREEFVVNVQESFNVQYDFNSVPAGVKRLLNPFMRNVGI